MAVFVYAENINGTYKKAAFEAGDFTSVDSDSTILRLENFCGITFTDKDKIFLKNLMRKLY